MIRTIAVEIIRTAVLAAIALGAVFRHHFFAQQHCRADVGLGRLAKRRGGVKVVGRILNLKLYLIKVAANREYLVSAERSAVKTHRRHAVLRVAPVNELAVELVRR